MRYALRSFESSRESDLTDFHSITGRWSIASCAASRSDAPPWGRSQISIELHKTRSALEGINEVSNVELESDSTIALTLTERGSVTHVKHLANMCLNEG